ncbi:hypothetical protein [Haloprofundus halobius]|uniref:hypothetical protein n=1 Tax=Haloprofundus halobius TaxID=2876194 RepID=UPI001CCA3716|nr:hypothetical protein [Haloprofundus halobius]
MTDDDLRRSTRRLGDRFGTASDSSEDDVRESETNDGPPVDDKSTNDSTADSASSAASDSEPVSERSKQNAKRGIEPEWVPTTLYLPEQTRREFRRFLKRLTLDHPEIEEAQKRELHAALIQVGMEQPEAVAERTDELRTD